MELGKVRPTALEEGETLIVEEVRLLFLLLLSARIWCVSSVSAGALR
jgi:hypothetical protein